ncbi:MAG: LOW QUALITY PROTEIN: hypothetical protein BJ554DRAFT_2271, partial [Olpidium bornovanus]
PQNKVPFYLNGCRVPDERDGHLQALGRDVADGRFHVVGDPFDEVAGVLVLHVEHLFVDLFHAHPAAEHGRDREVPPVARVGRGHHVLGVEHLLGQFRHREGAVLLRTPRSQRGEPDHEKPREGDHVDGKLPQVCIELAGKPEAGGDPGHDRRDEVVQISVRRGGELQRPEANVVQGLVVDAEGFVRVFHKLMDGKRRVIRLDNRIGDLRKRDVIRTRPYDLHRRNFR